MHNQFAKPYRKLITCLTIVLFGVVSPALAEDNPLEATFEGQVSFSNSKTPLWLNANKYGLSTLTPKNAYARANILYSKDSLWNHFDINIGTDIVLPFHYYYKGYEKDYISKLIIQQVYGEVTWKKITVFAGMKQFPAQLRNNLLSSGAQTLGINSRPIPQLRLYRDTWWEIPGLRNWLGFKGHICFGLTTDADWQETFTSGTKLPYNRWLRHHEKAVYLRIGKPKKLPLTAIIGLEMAAQFGGTLYNYKGTDQNGYRSFHYISLGNGWENYWNALTCGGGGADESKYVNAEGNHLGSWVARLEWDSKKYTIGAYLDHFFEDHSGLFFLDYDGYGSGDNWNVKEDIKYLRYPMRDFQLGLDLKLKEFTPIHGVTLEYMTTMYQSGPIYHDHNETTSDHIGGIDEFYNNSNTRGWQHWGQAIGNPLYRSPMYNTDGNITFKSNRFFAWHFGANGSILRNLDYRVLYTWQKSYGTYLNVFAYPLENTSILAELTYRLPDIMQFHSPMIRLAYGADMGKLLGDNSGFQFTVQYKY